MRKGFIAAVAVLFSVSTLGCIAAPVVPPLGLIYTKINAPLAPGSAEFGSRKGEATTTSVMGLFAWGDGSIKAAARDGGITQVKHVDYQYRNVILGFVQRYKTIAYGE